MSVKFQIKLSNGVDSKTLSISNPKEGLTASDAQDFVSPYNLGYGTDFALASAKYITTSETKVYPAA